MKRSSGGARAHAAPVLFAAAVTTIALTLLALAPAGAQTSETGKEKAQARGCVTCHGLDGRGTAPPYPNLAGQSDIYLEQQLEAYRSGGRQGEQMSIVTRNLTDEDIADLAAYYAGLDPCGAE